LEHRASMNTFGLDKEINVPLNIPVEHDDGWKGMFYVLMVGRDMKVDVYQKYSACTSTHPMSAEKVTKFWGTYPELQVMTEFGDISCTANNSTCGKKTELITVRK